MDLNLHSLRYDCPKCGDDCTDLYVEAKCMVILNLDDRGEVRDHNTQYETFDLDSMAECSNHKCKHRGHLRDFLDKSSRSTLMIRKLKEDGWRVRSYSGRGMNGKCCVGVDVDSVGETVAVGAFLGNDCPGEPSYDNMGRGFVVYWPHVPWPESEQQPYCPHCGEGYYGDVVDGEEVECSECGSAFVVGEYRM